MNILSFGAGIQTVCLASMCLNGDYPKPDHIIFADTGWETQGTYDYLIEYKKMFNGIIPFHVVKSTNIYTDVMRSENTFAAIPLYTFNEKGKKAILRRQCTMQYKIRPITKKIRSLCGLKRYQHGKVPVNLWIGISIDEADRMKPNIVKWFHNTYPLIDLEMSRRDCIDYLIQHGIGIPPKSACVCCPYRSDSYFANEKRNVTQDWMELIRFEEQLNKMKVADKASVFIHNQRLPINQVVFKDKGEAFVNECDGYCGI